MIVGPVKPGDVLADKYRVERVLGQGGMGLIVAATHVELDERVAIKFLLGVPSEASARRFLTEARAAAKVKNEHVCRAFDFGRTENGEPYIVMEYLEGRDLGDELAARGPLPAAEVADWARQACEGIASAHALGIVHRDIKPENLFLADLPGGKRVLKVLDFGVSKLPDSSVTKSAVAMGSPLYMAPEQMSSSRDVDARADVWSLGATLYELLSGRPPFDAPNVLALAAMVRESEIVPLGEVRPDLPEDLARIVMRCLSKDRELRYRDGAELGEALGAGRAEHARHVDPKPSVRLVPSASVDEPVDELRATQAVLPVTRNTDSPPANPASTLSDVPPPASGRGRLVLAGLVGVCGLGVVIALGVASRSGAGSGPGEAGLVSASASMSSAPSAPSAVTSLTQASTTPASVDASVAQEPVASASAGPKGTSIPVPNPKLVSPPSSSQAPSQSPSPVKSAATKPVAPTSTVPARL
jgi:serine/threonine-protein kinase